MTQEKMCEVFYPYEIRNYPVLDEIAQTWDIIAGKLEAQYSPNGKSILGGQVVFGRFDSHVVVFRLV